MKTFFPSALRPVFPIPLLLFFLLAAPGPAGRAWAVGMSGGVNSAGVIDFPTALDQTRRHTFHFTLDMVDIAETDLRIADLRYGLQLGNFQLLTDFYRVTQPEPEFAYLEVKAKLRILPLEDLRTDISAGILTRQTDESAKEAYFEGRNASLFVVSTSQVFLLGTRPMVLNFYLDNLVFNFGFKAEAYQFINAVAEFDYLHYTESEDNTGYKIGMEVEGEQNFYFQLFYSSRFENLAVQIGSGF